MTEDKWTGDRIRLCCKATNGLHQKKNEVRATVWNIVRNILLGDIDFETSGVAEQKRASRRRRDREKERQVILLLANHDALLPFNLSIEMPV